MVVATLLWGATFVVIRDSLHRLDPVALVFGRFAVAALVLLVVLLRRGRLPARALLVNGLISGLFVGGCYVLQAVGLTRTSAGSSAFLTCAGSLFAGLFAWPVVRQRPGAVLLAGLGVAMAGAALMSLDATFRLGVGELITLVGALSYAFGVAWAARLGEDVDPVAIAFVQSVAIALVLVPRAPLAMSQIGALDGVGWARFAYLAIAGSLIAPLLQFHALRAIPAGRVGLLLGLEPVFALVFATTFGAERFVLRWWAGAALILTAVLLVEWRAAAAPRAPASAIPGSAAKPSGPGGS